MMRVTANIGFLFTEHPFLDRFAAAAAAGFSRVECHYPYAHPVGEIRARMEAAGVALTGLNTHPGDLDAGEFGLAGLPGRESDFRRAFDQALAYAEALGCRSIHAMAGIVPEGRRAAALDTYRTNILWAAEAARGTGMTVLLEPISAPGYLVRRSDEMATLLAEIGSPGVRMLFDIFHVDAVEGDVLGRLERHRAVIGHVQIAGLPDRREPDESTISLGEIVDALRQIGYEGLVGLEYRPRGRTESGLGWLQRYGC